MFLYVYKQTFRELYGLIRKYCLRTKWIDPSWKRNNVRDLRTAHKMLKLVYLHKFHRPKNSCSICHNLCCGLCSRARARVCVCVCVCVCVFVPCHRGDVFRLKWCSRRTWMYKTTIVCFRHDIRWFWFRQVPLSLLFHLQRPNHGPSYKKENDMSLNGAVHRCMKGYICNVGCTPKLTSNEKILKIRRLL